MTFQIIDWKQQKSVKGENLIDKDNLIAWKIVEGRKNVQKPTNRKIETSIHRQRKSNENAEIKQQN